MLYQQTLDQLYAMKLIGMAEALEEQRSTTQHQELTFEERLALLIQRQYLWKENRALATRLKNARLKIPACIEDINYRHPRGLKRELIEQMIASDWIKAHRNCLIIGPTGVGKTYLGCAFADRACKDGYRALYYYAPELFRNLKAALLDGSFTPVLRKLLNTNLLVIDDFGLENVNSTEYRYFLETLDNRHHCAATLITSQYALNTWHQIIGDDTVADAILDRIVHNSYRIELDGESMRKRDSSLSKIP